MNDLQAEILDYIHKNPNQDWFDIEYALRDFVPWYRSYERNFNHLLDNKYIISPQNGEYILSEEGLRILNEYKGR